jgi:8-oxo-dGDP phosphatase
MTDPAAACDDARMDGEVGRTRRPPTNSRLSTSRGDALDAVSPTVSTDAEERTIVSGPWTRHARRIAYENAWITIWHDDVTRPDGAPGVYGVVHFANVAAGVLAIDDGDRVLLVGQHRYALDAYSWEIPEGGVPDGETAEDGARRELLEETGVAAASWRELARVHLSNSVSDENAVLFLATGLSRGEATPDGTEELVIRWVPFPEVLSMTLDGRITDAMTVVAVERLALIRAGFAPDDPRAG